MNVFRVGCGPDQFRPVTSPHSPPPGHRRPKTSACHPEKPQDKQAAGEARPPPGARSRLSHAQAAETFALIRRWIEA